MARKIEIPLSVNPRDLVRGLKVSERAFDDLEDSIEDVTREGDDLSDEFRDLARSADRAGDKMERSFDGVDRELGDIEDEANQSAKEFGSAFRGDPVEALEEVQSYLAEIISVKLPGFAGAAAAVAGGAALGAVVAAVEKWRERQEEINQPARDYLDVINENRAGVEGITDALLAQKVLEEASVEQYQILAELAAGRQQTVEEYVRRTLSGEQNTTEQLAQVEARRAEIADEILRLTGENTAESRNQLKVLQDEDRSLQQQGENLRDVGQFIGDNTTAAERANSAYQAGNRALQEQQDSVRRAGSAWSNNYRTIQDATRAAQSLNREMDNAARGRVLRVSIETIGRVAGVTGSGGITA